MGSATLHAEVPGLLLVSASLCYLRALSSTPASSSPNASILYDIGSYHRLFAESLSARTKTLTALFNVVIYYNANCINLKLYFFSANEVTLSTNKYSTRAIFADPKPCRQNDPKHGHIFPSNLHTAKFRLCRVVYIRIVFHYVFHF